MCSDGGGQGGGLVNVGFNARRQFATHTRTHAHTLTLTLTLFHMLSLLRTHTHAHARSRSLSHTHTYIHTQFEWVQLLRRRSGGQAMQNPDYPRLQVLGRA